VHHGDIRIDISDAILAETIRVLRDKLQWDGYLLCAASMAVRSCSTVSGDSWAA
jgi:hypothetical protein